MAEAAIHPGPSAQELSDPAWAWLPYEPDAERPWNLQWAGHLYRRAGFGANWEQLQLALQAGPQATIDKLVDPDGQVREFNAAADEYEKAAAQSASADSLRAWWLRRMCQTPFPLLEKMTLFWHNHFAIGNDRVSNGSLMCRYLQSLRQNALGDFGVLLEGLLNQPALFAGLDGHANGPSRPGAHVARVLLEQFTVGPGQFAETDVQAVARALSGWFISQNELHYSEREHVSTRGALLGEVGDFRKEDVVRILSRHRATAQAMVRKLYRWFISETNAPSDSLLVPLVDRFTGNLDIVALVETMLRSNLFFSPAAWRQKIKSPVEFALSLIRPLNGVVGTVQLGSDLAGLGQDLCNPPTVEGWAGHTCWINHFTVVGRARLAEALLAGSGAYGGKLYVGVAAAKAGKQSSQDAIQFWFELFLDGDIPADVRRAIEVSQEPDPSPPVRDPSDRLRHAAIRIACLPEFHLA